MTWPPNPITYLGQTVGRNPGKQFGIKQADRLSHTYIMGKTGTGKSTLLEQMLMQDIKAGRGCCLIDPHGDLVERIATLIPDYRKDDCIYLDVPHVPHVYGYNPLRHVRDDKRSLAASGLMDIFEKMWSDSWGPRTEHILRNIILTLLEQPSSNLSDIPRLLSDDSFRKARVSKLKNEQVRHFWEKEYAKWSAPFRKNAIAPIQNKVGAFLTDPTVKHVLVDPQHDLSFRQIIDEQKVLLVNLSKGQIGEDAAHLLGGLLVTTLGLAAYSRAELPVTERSPFYLYVDEFQNFTTLSVVNMASELRKYGCGLILVNQYLSQLEPAVRDSVVGNCGTLISFRLGAKDAAFMSKEFAPVFSAQELTRLPNYRVCLKLMIDQAPSPPFSAKTLKT